MFPALARGMDLRICGIWLFLATCTAAALPGVKNGQESVDPLAAWRQGVRVHPVSNRMTQHTIHAYYVTSPESPDGRQVLFYASTTPEGHTGDVRILDRATGRERTLARGVTVEDAHRAACQQWVSGGKWVVFHDCREGQWMVVTVDPATGQERILARDRQLGWVQPGASLVPIYGKHWAPGEHRDLELLDLATGGVRTAVTAAAVREAYPEWVARFSGGRELSIFFPILSPDLQSVFFKMATPLGGDFRSSQASKREGLVCYDLAQSRFRFMSEKWGHPAWHPDARSIIEVGNLLIDRETGKQRKIPNGPVLSGAHPSVSPDGRLFVTDGMLPGDKQKEQWSIVLGRLDGGGYTVLHRFDNSRGARSWRKSHPHPHFSPDGRRIYFNVNSGPWTQLFVAECAPDR